MRVENPLAVDAIDLEALEAPNPGFWFARIYREARGFADKVASDPWLAEISLLQSSAVTADCEIRLDTRW